MIFLVGFIPGFYLSYALFTKAKLQLLGAILLSCIIGIFFGYISSKAVPYLNDALYSHNKYFVGTALLVILPLEIVFILIHFFFFRKQKKSTQKRK